MPLPLKPYREWGTTDLQQLVEDPPAEENARLDFKKECNLLHQEKNAQKKARRDILVDVAAMANGVGGALLLGVEERRKPGAPPVAAKLVGVPQKQVEPLKKAISSLVDTHLHIRPGALRYEIVPAPTKRNYVVLIVEVPQNTHSLSMVTHNDLCQFWVRRGTDNRLMTIDEIQYQFEMASKVRSYANEELVLIKQTQLLERLDDKKDDKVPWYAAVPIGRSRDHVPDDTELIRDLIKQS